MTSETVAMIYALVGLGYWAVNIFIRRIHEHNDPDIGWLIVPVWLTLWPLCFLLLGAVNIARLLKLVKPNKNSII